MTGALDPTPIVDDLENAFTDVRLNDRLATIVRAMARAPSASWPSVCTPAELEGAYRFFSNVRVTPEAILKPHFEHTAQRAQREPRVLVVHDSTDFSFRVDGARKGLGRSRKSTQTFFGHFSMALSADGTRRALGLVAMTTWVRGPEPTGAEHPRWLTQMRDTARSLDLGTRAIHVCDREADDYFILHELCASDTRFIIRANADRWTIDETGAVAKLERAMASCEIAVQRHAALSRRRQERSAIKAKTHPARAPRTAKLAIAATSLALVRPQGYVRRFPDRSHLPDALPLHVVRVWEPSPPEGCTPVEWVLYTNESIATAQDLLDIVDHYRARWVIEEYFKALKTGCGYENRQLEEYESLRNALAVSVPIAYEALRIRTLARTAPDVPASAVATDLQVALLRQLGRRKLPEHPTARDVLLAIAALGGHIQYAPDPGWLTIYRGCQKLALLTEGALLAAQLQHHSDQR